jgi:biofilm PGA synthesis N-glycosyltransferase PgaC
VDWHNDLRTLLTAFYFGYPFVASWYWMAGAIFYRWLIERHGPLPDNPPALQAYPTVSILVPCHNEEQQIEETLAALVQVDYPNFEIIAINDGSSDRTGEILETLAVHIPQMRVVHLSSNQGKANALNTGALLAASEYMVCVDGDTLLDRNAITWLVRRMQSDGTLGAITGNPRIRNRTTVLGRLQVGEFSAIVGLIKRTQMLHGWLFSVTGAIVCCRKRAVHEAGWWSSATLTDDVDLTWRLQLAGWSVVFEPNALCWVLMPETLRGLWRQRLRWSVGGTQTILQSLPKMLLQPLRHRGGWPVLLNYLISVMWAYLMLLRLIAWTLQSVGISLFSFFPMYAPSLAWWGTALALTYLTQAFVSFVIDTRYEKQLGRLLFWVIWYPLVFWILQALVAVAGLPRALSRFGDSKGTWVSPDRRVV